LCRRGIERVFSVTTPSIEQATAQRSVAVSSTSRFIAHRRKLIQPLTIDEALTKLGALISPITDAETVPATNALGRVVAEDITSPVPVPAFANSAMDGYAVLHSDLQDSGETRLTVQGQSLAGHPFTSELQANHAVRIFTGAAIPPGADTIVIQENTTPKDPDGVVIHTAPTKGAYTRAIGHDIDKDSLLLPRCTSLRAFEIAQATTSGLENLRVFRKLRIGVFATGDELRSPGTPLGPGEIYESNRAAIISLLDGLPVEVSNLGILPDDEQITRDALSQAATQHDALITSGGVSVGDADFVRAAIEAQGQIDFWRLNLRPGKPFAFGKLNTTSVPCLIFGLPGNVAGSPGAWLSRWSSACQAAGIWRASRPEGDSQCWAARVSARTPGRLRPRSSCAHHLRSEL